MKNLLIGVLVGLILGGGGAVASEKPMKKYMGFRTGEVLVCRKTPGVPACERDVHGSGRRVVVWCNGKNLGYK